MTTPASTSATLTSFSKLIGQEIAGHIIREIEIPLIQRDYAQGRKTENVTRIRENFIDSLCKALLPDATAIDLDFIFGDVEDKEGENHGKFYPLDGQQRLTTLFLLHCYLAWQTGVRLQDQSWRKFSYATRPGARDFCDFLVRCQPDFSDTLSAWIKDHAEYLPTWHYDPSIQSMLVMLDALHGWFTAHDPDFKIAWAKLVDEENPAIRFHVLPMKANGLTDELYIKMNSRGKPLTPFENFKAHFEDMLKKAYPDMANDFAQKVDTDWSDILWPYRGEDHLIDDEFMRYFRFITEVCAWKSEVDFNENTRDDELAEWVYGLSAINANKNLTLLFQAFDVWKGKSVKDEFESIFTHQAGGASTPLLMFKSIDKEGVDLFHACCHHYGTPRQWTLADTLLLYGVLMKFIYEVPEDAFPKRLRILRNLVEASDDEIRTGERNNMPKLLADVEQIIIHGNLRQVSTFNQVQVKNEEDKAAILLTMPTLAADLHRLEDHDLLRGGLTVFDLDPKLFTQRAEAFIAIFDKSAYSGSMPWMLVTGALLANGDYSRRGNRWTGHRSADFGAPKKNEPWQALFRGRKGESEHPTSKSLKALLDAVTTGNTLQNVIDAYLNDPETLKDWRYYFVKYDNMREGASGRYTLNESSYQVCMLDKERMSSDYYDPYLFAAVQQAGISPDSIANAKWPRCYTSDETNHRKLVLKNSGLQIECVDQGWQMSGVPTDTAQKSIFDQVCSEYDIDKNILYCVKQVNGIDFFDRIELGGDLLKKFVCCGF
jgi:hypothetical protein